ncbi:hypothetical protein, variant [Phialophora macrospora]|uniref:C3H1-type domain-containing protein n=1 Tax=Phialophora macrospora TaxID=1851006 RepID=A0A0D2GAD2_9EURO|nr:hypothetical protein PV04_04846 [Phialophora macrospora]KIW68935.1 hypothetical protein, variant [Phialophora macrospora]
MAAQQLKPQFFVTRQNGAMVPLIAMDELPLHVQVQDVPRSLSAFEIGGMTGIGLVEARHQFYVIESINNMTPGPCVPANAKSSTDSGAGRPPLRSTDLPTPCSDTDVNVDANENTDTSSAPDPSSDPSASSVAEEAKSSRATSPDIIAPHELPPQGLAPASAAPLAWRTNATPIPNPGLTELSKKSLPEYDENPEMPAFGEKVYCSYWLRNGECSFAQTGCKYKHVMPISLQVLEAIGLRDLPEWFRQAHGCGSLTVNGGRNGLSFGITLNDVSGLPGKSGPKTWSSPKPWSGPKPRSSPLAIQRAFATHINSKPVPRLRPHGDQPNPRPGNSRPTALGAARIPRVLTDSERAAERERRDKRLAAAFDADMESNACSEMTDAEMVKIRDREQAGWEEEQKARQAAAAGKVEKRSEAIEKGSGSSEERAKASESGSGSGSGNAEKKSGPGSGSRHRTPRHIGFGRINRAHSGKAHSSKEVVKD